MLLATVLMQRMNKCRLIERSIEERKFIILIKKGNRASTVRAVRKNQELISSRGMIKMSQHYDVAASTPRPGAITKAHVSIEKGNYLDRTMTKHRMSLWLLPCKTQLRMYPFEAPPKTLHIKQ